MSEPMDISGDREVAVYGTPDQNYELIVRLHDENTNVTKVRYFVAPTWDGADISSLQNLPRTKDDSYLVVDQNSEHVNAANALQTIFQQHNISFLNPQGAAELQNIIAKALTAEKNKKRLPENHPPPRAR